MSENHVFFQARDKNVTSVGLLATLDPSVNTSDQWCNEHTVSGIRRWGEIQVKKNGGWTEQPQWDVLNSSLNWEVNWPTWNKGVDIP
jgi:hypothetical protein